jgi:very-short-patch-repair endonuclease
MPLRYNGNLIENAKALRKNGTKQEKHLWYDFLCKYPVRFQRQKTIGSYIVDFYCCKAQLVIELDGSQHYEENAKRYDTVRTEYLESLGLRVLRFLNSDVDRHFEGVCGLIDKTVKERIATGFR